MNFEIFVVKRIISSKNYISFSNIIIKIGITSIALGLCLMLLSVAIVTGFRQQIRDKVIGFGGHIKITKFVDNTSFEEQPIDIDLSFINSLKKIEGVNKVHVYATKPGIIKTDKDIEGIVFKGVDKNYDWTFFKKNLIEGTIVPKTADTLKSNNIIISKTIADKLKLKVNDNIVTFFVQNPPRQRKFKVTGIYSTGFDDFDKVYILGDLAHIQKLNDWKSSQAGGYEVTIDDFDKIDNITQDVYDNTTSDLNTQNIKELFPQIFGWLDLLDVNVYIILVLMTLVAAINMISTLLILIIERTNMIGIMKAVGAKNINIRKIFLYNAAYILLKGLLWGNLIGVGLCLLQHYFGIVKLPVESYYLSTVPININVLYFLAVNLGCFFITVIMLIIPSMIISRISPIKAIKME